MKNKHTHFFKDHEPVRKYDKFILIFLAVSFVCSSLIVIFALQFEQIFSRYNFNDFPLGGTAPYELAPAQDILWTDEDKTEKRRAEVERTAPVVFQFDDRKPQQVLDNFRIFQEYVVAKKKGTLEPKEELYYQNLGFDSLIGENDYRLLLELSGEDFDRVLETAKALLLELMNSEFLSLSEIDRNQFNIQVLEIVRQTAGKPISNDRLLSEVTTRSSLSTVIQEKTELLKLSAAHESLVTALIMALAEENCVFDLSASLINQKKAAESIPPIQEVLRKNYPIITKGQEITKDLYSKILTFRKSIVASMANKIVSTLLFLFLIYVTAIFLLGNIFYGKMPTRGEAVFLIILELFYLVLSVFVFRIIPVEGNYPLSLFLPTAAIAVLVTIIMNPTAGVVFSFLTAATSLLIQNDLSSFLFAFFSGCAATALVIRVTRRIDLVKAGFFLLIVQSLLMATVRIFCGDTIEGIAVNSAGAALNGFLSVILSIGFLPLFEHLLNTPTRFRLMELSDINVPILKKMLVLAPGTYTHSINVANLSESASLAIGANPLLARVGAYYHDIGKLDQPEYFIENQDSLNRHDFLKPSLSAAVIKSHIKIGIEKAKEMDLPQEVIDIIGQHHGKGIISYFFNRAKAENENGDAVSPEDYSYQGKRPQSKEAAIVMLADAVEAASRSLKKPTIAKIEKLVWQIIIERFHAEELLESNLTFHDLEIIKRVFVQIIQGYLHQRIEYPNADSAAEAAQ